MAPFSGKGAATPSKLIPLPRRLTNRSPTVRRDVGFQWVSFWGGNHQLEITGPRAGSNLPSVKLWERLKPGRVEPPDLILDPNYHLGRAHLMSVPTSRSRESAVVPPFRSAAARTGLPQFSPVSSNTLAYLASVPFTGMAVRTIIEV